MKKTLAIAILFASAALAQAAHAASPLVGTWKNFETGDVVNITSKGWPGVDKSGCDGEVSNTFTQKNKSSIKKELNNSLDKAQAQKILKQLPEGLVQGYSGVCHELVMDFYLTKQNALVGTFCESGECSVSTLRKLK